ncbi:penicillin-binding transpeptidase domain-containing protein [Pokkaliibacter sp. MBI-7]|uniref:peptidoglycan D,D-transpeptidase FtsI family protein n=1 Tax=Pokkaliibacter sp. MBI-7 TaxID=3040600 RepID=UPI00244A4D4F|nr:penicillin-binding transpeptidase domain-containing protein [Pokkaliibacter sp. MBI-7]MDH2431629.1 penicillin-binding transpeptidase domain-containing protein [Pokkaliibacter sp. MBI-7]
MRNTNTGLPFPWRVRIVLGMLGALALILLGQLINLQVVHQNFLNTQGDARALRKEVIPAHRGMIVDRNGEPLAISAPVETLWAEPQILSEYPDRWADLATALETPADVLAQRIKLNATKEFMYLRRQMTPNDAAKVVALGIPGVYSRKEYRRFYPAAEVTSHVVGFTDVDGKGQEGLELAYDSWLEGVPGLKDVLRDRLGRNIKDLKLVKQARPGKDLVLSIDLRLQYLAYQALKGVVAENGAKAGTMVVLDAKTGEVLAMVNQPAYNPNNRVDVSSSSLRNRAITDMYEPGSTMKALTVSSALMNHVITPDTKIDTTPGRLRITYKTISDHRNYGVLDITGIITKSSNVGASKISMMLPEGALWQTFHSFGLGQNPQTGFPGEQPGELPFYKPTQVLQLATMSYGYGLTVTPLQLARAYVPFANGGKLFPVSMVKRANPVEPTQVVTPEVAHDVLKMLETVTESGGTATRAQVPGYHLAGKTGTVHKVGPNGYEANNYFSVFTGIAPASDPRLVAAIIIDDPSSGEYFGGAVAAPVFGRFIAGAMRLLNIPPDDLEGLIKLQGKKS